MTLIQLEYLLALDKYRHFATAAEHSYVTQPTLSMQIQKLEDELGVQIFDRSVIPVEATPVGRRIIEQAKNTLAEFKRIQDIIHDHINILEGTTRLAIIPTLAPYLLPLFLNKFLTKYPQVNLVIQELTTKQILAGLKDGSIDMALVATPLKEPYTVEYPLFYETFVAYLDPGHPLAEKRVISTQSLEMNNVWLLNDSHCMRSQVFDMCENFSGATLYKNVQYESGSLETLKKLVDVNKGMTFLPRMATLEMTGEELDKIRFFEAPEPVREISLITHQNFSRKAILQALEDEILYNIPQEFKNKNIGKRILSIRLT